MIDQLLDHRDLAMFEHMQRNCVYQELEACVKLKKDAVRVMRDQVNRYRRSGYPHNNGLAETTAVLRRHSAQVRDFNERWWAEIASGSQRDQLSVDFVCWKLGLRYAHLEGVRTRSPHFAWRNHR
jgi:hypothetical protein